MVEQIPVKNEVVGSSPTGGALRQAQCKLHTDVQIYSTFDVATSQSKLDKALILTI